MITLQNFISPEHDICTETPLYHHEEGSIGVSFDTGTYVLPRSGRLWFNTYFNLFDLNRWSHSCALDGLFLECTGTGEVEILVIHAQTGRSHDIIYREMVTWEEGQPHLVDLSKFAHDTSGVLSVRLTAIGDKVLLDGARFATRSLSGRALPDLTVSITTFKREAEVQSTVARLEEFLADFPYGDHIRVQVVDNGKSAEIQKSDHVTPYANRNLGGAGGFSRGLLEAEAAGASHCLFMDDDASFHMENIARTYMFLALAQDPKTAVAGAMITNDRKWALWENGAWFDGVCHPIAHGTDLRNPEAVLQMQFDAAAPQPANLYGGWWFFAFPIAQVKHYPFPFFVRGDDSSFSLANDFTIKTLNGVVSFQDDFRAKESPQVHYLDLRYHLIHHLTFDNLARSPLRTAWVGLRLMMRSLLQLHYSSAEAQLMAMRDVMVGPQFFDDNIDMSARRAAIKDLSADETWQPRDQIPINERHGRMTRLSRSLRTKLGLLTLNGHIVPFWNRFASHLKVEAEHRGLVFYTLGAAEVTFLNSDRNQFYTVKHDKKRFYKLLWEIIKTTRAFCRDFDAIKSAYHQGYGAMTTKEYWEKTLDEGPSPDLDTAVQKQAS